ncbi:hypothetical protein ABBQ38_000191 [Trebouxia sp. C0009 RCD-2024]
MEVKQKIQMLKPQRTQPAAQAAAGADTDKAGPVVVVFWWLVVVADDMSLRGDNGRQVHAYAGRARGPKAEATREPRPINGVYEIRQ